MTRIETMTHRLTESLAPTHLDIVDDSAQHAGHAGAATGLGHYTVIINSPKFDGKTRIAKHQLVYGALGDMMQTDIHALSIVIQ